MSMYTLLRNEPSPCMDEIIKSLEGNLCRCTGYRPILEGFRTFSQENQQCCGKDGSCCRNKSNSKPNVINGVPNQLASPQIKVADQLQDVGSLKPYDPSQDLIFPPELQLFDYNDQTSLVFRGPRVTWFRPANLTQLLDLKAKYPDAKVVVGNTEIGIEMRIKNQHYPVLISCTNIADLKVISTQTGGIRVGSSVTLSQLMAFLKSSIDKLPVQQTKSYEAIVEMLQWFAGKQIRNVACVGGNIMTASPISDLNPLLCAAGAILTVASKERGSREITMDEKFFVSYRKTAVMEDEILISILIPFTQEWEYFQGFKQAHRRDDDIAIVNSGFRVRLKPNSDIVDDVVLAFGGMAPTTIIARNSGKVISHRRWDDELLSAAVDGLTQELDLPVDVPGGMAQYRQTLAVSFFYKFYISVRMALAQLGFGMTGNGIQQSIQSSTLPYSKPSLSGTQVFEQVSTEQNPVDPVGRPLIHQSAIKQVTGEAIYIDDMPTIQGELNLVLVVSRRARAKIVSIDTSKALTLPGVVDYIDAADNPTNKPLMANETLEMFPKKEVICEGQILGAILADTKDHALVASRAVHVEYEELKPLVTIQDAIEAKSFFDNGDACLEGGDVISEFSRCDHVMEGEMQGGGQEHFYMEPHIALAVPREDDGVELFTSTQVPSDMQKKVAEILGVPNNRVVCRVKRVGGGFGGKELQCEMFVIPTVIAARKHKRSVRCFLERQEDMMITGGRNPYYAEYKVGFDTSGKISALQMEFYLNAGCILECSAFVLYKALYTFDNCYNFHNFRIKGHLCKTNIPSNTAFRGFGSPQMLLVIENIMTDVAISLNISQNKVREVNMYKSTDVTFCNMPVDECHFRECWDLVLQNVDFEKSRELVNKYNRENRWRKRGIAVTPAKMPIGIFEVKHMNQGGALVHVYTDGSVLLTCGGIEMGQGLFTKMIQVASRVLCIPTDRIVVNETSTDFVPNTIPTAASSSTDLNGFAVIDACKKIMQRLQPFIENNPHGGWDEWVKAAFIEMVSLSATGFYGTHYINYNAETNTGRKMMYCVCGVAYSEVEIDCLTGDHELLKTEIVMDVGKSLNPAIDVGQIEGAFIQGYGLVALEQCKVTPTGRVLTTGPGAYKIPSVGNIPAQFNVTLLKGGILDKAVYSSKGLGEPPLGLSMSVFFAFKDAILSARADDRVHGVFPLNTPATPERIRMACSDRFTKRIGNEFDKKPNSVPFFVTP